MSFCSGCSDSQPSPARSSLSTSSGATRVVLGVVENRQQDVQVAQRLGEGQRLRIEDETHVPRVAPLRELRVQRDRFGRHRPAERLEELTYELGTAPGRDRGHLDVQRACLVREFGLRPALAPHRAAEHGAQRDREQRGGSVRAVVDVLRERRVRRTAASLALAAPDERHRVDLQQQRGRAALGGRLGVEDVRGAVGRGEPLRVVGMLVQQVAEVGRGTFRGAGGADRQEHGG